MRYLKLIFGFVVAAIAAAGLPDSVCAADDASSGSDAPRHTYVLVHGAWAGGWEHKEVDKMLTADGHKVYRLTLTGQGERVHLATPDIDLETHIQDVVNVILWEQLTDVVLVGHSYGGMVITGVVDRLPDRFRHVIYYDAFLPEDGESLYTTREGGGPRFPAVDGFVALGNQDRSADPPPHIVRQSVKTFDQPISLKNQEVARRVPTTYLLTVDPGKTPEQDGFFYYYERAKARGWPAAIMEGSHVVHMTHPRELADLFEGIPGEEAKAAQ